MAISWVAAAIKILEEKENKTLHYREIAEEAIERNLVETQAANPPMTLYACLYNDNYIKQQRGELPLFEISKGYVSLVGRDDPIKSITQSTKKYFEEVKSRLLKKLIAMKGTDFEQYVEYLLTRMEYSTVERRGGGGDEGIDLISETQFGVNAIKAGIQVKSKQLNKRIGEKDIRYLRDVLPKFQCTQGVFITTTKFTSQAIRAAEESHGLPLVLIDGDKLVELAMKYEVGIKKKKVEIYFSDPDSEVFQFIKKSK